MIEKYKRGELSEEQMSQLEADLMAQMFKRQTDNAVRNDLKSLAAELNDAEKNAKNTEGVKIIR